ncbi:hypothetical protein N7486_003212 [Penicillium sp. IBT 16267x]|nr:hypothetical protein N7486_003212 [Penicillium sp. IBT 16267x]
MDISKRNFEVIGIITRIGDMDVTELPSQFPAQRWDKLLAVFENVQHVPVDYTNVTSRSSDL